MVCSDCYNKAIADKEVVAEVSAIPIQVDNTTQAIVTQNS